MKGSINSQRKSWKVTALFLLLICCVFLQPQTASASGKKNTTVKVLFVGNSKTRRKNIPEKFYEIATAMGKKVKVDRVTVKGKSLNYLANNYGDSIQRKKYDYVVLQERTVNLSDYSQYLKGANKVANLVREKNPDVQIILRDVWVLDSSSKKEKKTAYKNSAKVASMIGANLALDGPAFDLCQKRWPDIELFSDKKHQTTEGAYLSACCIYKAIFGKAPINCTYTAGMSEKRAKRLQKVARDARM